MAGAVLAMVSLVEFVWYTTTSSSEKVMDRMVSSEDTADEPMPVDLMAALIQLMTFVSRRCIVSCIFLNHLLSC